MSSGRRDEDGEREFDQIEGLAGPGFTRDPPGLPYGDDDFDRVEGLVSEEERLRAVDAEHRHEQHRERLRAVEAQLDRLAALLSRRRG